MNEENVKKFMQEFLKCVQEMIENETGKINDRLDKIASAISEAKKE